ncbi:hypothetical protein AGMMS50229_02470 [Campylobacterota bacterium]|nr:hypothetical protein AGMMS50229_02470 [Campylobacterota bacterium]
MEAIFSLQSFDILGIVLNIVMTFAFGLYKSLRMNIDEMIYLMDRYPVKTKLYKLIALWFIPYAGVCYIFYQLFLLQRILYGGGSVYDYMEAKLSADYQKQKVSR